MRALRPSLEIPLDPIDLATVAPIMPAFSVQERKGILLDICRSPTLMRLPFFWVDVDGALCDLLRLCNASWAPTIGNELDLPVRSHAAKRLRFVSFGEMEESTKEKRFRVTSWRTRSGCWTVEAGRILEL